MGVLSAAPTIGGGRSESPIGPSSLVGRSKGPVRSTEVSLAHPVLVRR